MNYIEIIVIAFALAVDATVYSFSYGLILRQKRFMASLWLALVVGLYQAGMPLLGYLGGLGVKDFVSSWDHWLVLVVFAALGGTVIYKAWTGGDEEEEAKNQEPLGFLACMIYG